LGHVFRICAYVLPQKKTSEIDSFFLRFLGRPERFTGWAHMQSVHACAVQTHFSVFACFLKNRLPRTMCWLHFGSNVHAKLQILAKKRDPQIVPQKGAPPGANKSLIQSPEAPGDTPRVRVFQTRNNCSSNC